MPDAKLVSMLFDAIAKPAALGDATGSSWRTNSALQELLDSRRDTATALSLRFYRDDPVREDITATVLGQARHGAAWSGRVALGTAADASVSIHAELRAEGDSFLLLATEGAPDAQQDRHSVPGAWLLRDRLTQGIIAAARAGKSLAMVLIGIDRFRALSQGIGAGATDALLYELAQRLKACVRNSDTVAHYRDDQFALVLQIASADDGAIVARKVLESMHERFAIADSEQSLTVSVGISLAPVDGSDADSLLKLADSALHEARERGGDNYQFFAEEFNVRARHRIELERGMRRALRDNEFRLFYQPKVSAKTHRIVGMEGLIRWFDPQGGMISPAAFIPVAEESGLIEPIGRWVMREACRQNRAWLDGGFGQTKVSVNVSGRQLHARDFVDFVAEVLRDTALPAHLLELEITESMLVQRTDEVIEKLRRVRDLGCHLSIDDFGTGYSSLSYLTRFPITTLKIDKAFVQGLETSDTTAEVAKAIISLSQGLKLEVVAEGAEQRSHIDFLTRYGCDAVQGYYYSKPVSAERFEELLRSGRIEGGEA